MDAIVYFSGIYLFVILSIVGGVVWLQISLSKKHNKWLGLILPFICFVCASFIIFSMLPFGSTVTNLTEIVDGNVVSKVTVNQEVSVLNIFFVYLILNIPTLILLLIYIANRKKIKVKNQLDKMNIQDLE